MPTQAPRRIVLFGASGLTGKNLLAELSKHDIPVLAVIREGSPFKAEDKIQTVRCNLLDVHQTALRPQAS